MTILRQDNTPDHNYCFLDTQNIYNLITLNGKSTSAGRTVVSDIPSYNVVTPDIIISIIIISLLVLGIISELIIIS